MSPLSGLEVALEGAISDKPGATYQNLVLVMDRRGDGWRRIRGFSLDGPASDRWGYVVKGDVNANAFDVDCLIVHAGDVWLTSQYFSRYHLRGTIASNGQLTGTWTGHWNGSPTSGRVKGKVRPTLTPAPDFVSIKENEHPRLMFRASDIPRLQEKLATPFGQVAKEAMAKDPVGQALLYRLTGDRRYWLSASAALRQEAVNDDYGAFRTGQIYASRQFLVAMILDLCWDEISSEERAFILKRLRMKSEELMWSAGGNRNPTSNWAGPHNGAAALSMLMWAGRLGDGPPAPYSRPVGRGTLSSPHYCKTHPLYGTFYRQDGRPVFRIPALYPASATVQPLVIGQRLGDWIWGSFVNGADLGRSDFFSETGGYAQTIPRTGQTFNSTVFTQDGPEDLSMRITALPDSFAVKGGGADVTALTADAGTGSMIFHTTFTLDKQIAVRLSPAKGTAIWLNSQACTNALAVYQLSPGTHRMLIVAVTNKPRSQVTRIDPVITDAQILMENLDKDVPLFRDLEKAYWVDNGHQDFEVEFTIDMSRNRVYQYHSVGIGEGGFQPEAGHYSHDGGLAPMTYASLHQKVFGVPLSPFQDVTAYIPRHLATNLRQTNGKSTLYGQPIHGINHISIEFLTRLFPIISPQYQPPVLDAWNVLSSGSKENPGRLFASNASAHSVVTFLNYPLDLTPAPATTPSMPLTWAAPRRGMYAFRNRYRDENDAVLQVYTKETVTGGWNHDSGGTFTLMAFGKEWAVSQDDRQSWRPYESIFYQQPAIGTKAHGQACGQTMQYSPKPDGSGSIAIDMSDFYESAPTRVGSDNNGYRFRPVGATAAMRGQRGLAIDYSGRSGAPVLLGIVDKVTTPIAPGQWIWQVPRTINKDSLMPSITGNVTVNERGFTLTQDGYVLTVTIIHPAKPVIHLPGKVTFKVPEEGRQKSPQFLAKEKAEKDKKTKNKSLDGLVSPDVEATEETTTAPTGTTPATIPHYDRPIPGLVVDSPDHVFAVATVTKGPGPTVVVTGSGLDAHVQIGEQRVVWDGTNVVIAP